MSMVQKLGGKAIDIFSNSRLIVSQVNGEYEARDKRMQRGSYPAQIFRRSLNR